MDVIIDNQYSITKLTSPVYFTKDATCHIQLPQQVDSKSRMKVNFKTSAHKDTFGGVLLYCLQRKDNDKSGKDTSISTQLLVIWGCKHNKLYSYAWLVEHESTLVWNEDKLKKLYHIYNSQDKNYHIINYKEWLLDDNTILKIVHKTSHGGFEMNVTISKGEHPSLSGRPLWIDTNR
jgi:hypothetical protein